MGTFTTFRRFLATIVVSLVLGVVAMPAAAGAHFADSSSISVRIGEADASATISVAIGPLSEVLGPHPGSADAFDQYADEVIDYIDQHLTVIGADGRVWAETYHDPARVAVEGYQAFTVDVRFDTHGADPTHFTLDYDAVIESVDGHQTVVVVTDADGSISNPGILDAGRRTLEVGDGAGSVAVADMVDYGFEHVLEGADHLLFLLTLLLVAPLVVAGGRWRPSPSSTATSRKVVHVITAFTAGHSLTLLISALGWVSIPARPVELLIAVSVGVAAVHAMRPLVARGEVIIAGVFGLVHGLAFAGILGELGLSGSSSVLALLAFNIGIELAQLATAALVFPALWLLSTSRWYPTFRMAGAGFALLASIGWGLERLEVVGNPLDPLEDAAIRHPLHVVAALLVAGGAAVVAERTSRPHATPDAPSVFTTRR